MPVVLPQKLFHLCIRHLTDILAHVLILAKVPTRIKFPQQSEDPVQSKRLSETQDPLAIAGRINQRNDVQLRIVAHVDEVLRRQVGEHARLAVERILQPVVGAVPRRADVVPEIRRRQHGRDLERWRLLLDRFPQRPLGLRLARGVDFVRVQRRVRAAHVAQDLLVPRVLVDHEALVGGRHQRRRAGRAQHQALDPGLAARRFEDVERAFDARRDDFVRVGAPGQHGGDVDYPCDALDGGVVGVRRAHVRDVDDFESLGAVLFRDVVDEELRFAGVARGAAHVEASCDHLFHDRVTDEAGCAGHEDGFALLDEGGHAF